MMTLSEIKELLAQQLDEVDIIDLLGITSYDIVGAFEDLIEERLDLIIRALDLDGDE